jgi:hypothetical protein
MLKIGPNLYNLPAIMTYLEEVDQKAFKEMSKLALTIEGESVWRSTKISGLLGGLMPKYKTDWVEANYIVAWNDDYWPMIDVGEYGPVSNLIKNTNKDQLIDWYDAAISARQRGESLSSRIDKQNIALNIIESTMGTKAKSKGVTFGKPGKSILKKPVYNTFKPEMTNVISSTPVTNNSSSVNNITTNTDLVTNKPTTTSTTIVGNRGKSKKKGKPHEKQTVKGQTVVLKHPYDVTLKPDPSKNFLQDPYYYQVGEFLIKNLSKNNGEGATLSKIIQDILVKNFGASRVSPSVASIVKVDERTKAIMKYLADKFKLPDHEDIDMLMEQYGGAAHMNDEDDYEDLDDDFVPDDADDANVITYVTDTHNNNNNNNRNTKSKFDGI